MRRRKFHKQLKQLGACSEATAWVSLHPKTKGAEEIWNDCEHPGWLLWLAARVGLPRTLVVRCLMDAGRGLLADLPRSSEAVVARAATELWAYGGGPIPDWLLLEVRQEHPQGWHFLVNLRDVGHRECLAAVANVAQDTLSAVAGVAAHQLCNDIRGTFFWEEVRAGLHQAMLEA